LNEAATIYAPPTASAPMEILPAGIAHAWQNDVTTVEAVASALSQKAGMTLPWKTIREVVGAALDMRFVSRDPTSAPWPCAPAEASGVRLHMRKEASGVAEPRAPYGAAPTPANMRAYRSTITINQLQDAGDIVPELLRIQQTWDTQITVDVSFTIGKEDASAPEDALQALKVALEKVGKDFE
jgi:hypothetical protein